MVPDPVVNVFAKITRSSATEKTTEISQQTHPFKKPFLENIASLATKPSLIGYGYKQKGKEFSFYTFPLKKNTREQQILWKVILHNRKSSSFPNITEGQMR